LAQTTGTTGTTGINIYCFSCPFGNYISSFNFVAIRVRTKKKIKRKTRKKELLINKNTSEQI